MVVTQNSLDPASKLYGHYAEFDSVDVDFLQSVRRWLSA